MFHYYLYRYYYDYRIIVIIHVVGVVVASQYINIKVWKETKRTVCLRSTALRNTHVAVRMRNWLSFVSQQFINVFRVCADFLLRIKKKKTYLSLYFCQDNETSIAVFVMSLINNDLSCFFYYFFFFLFQHTHHLLTQRPRLLSLGPTNWRKHSTQTYVTLRKIKTVYKRKC